MKECTKNLTSPGTLILLTVVISQNVKKVEQAILQLQKTSNIFFFKSKSISLKYEEKKMLEKTASHRKTHREH